VIHGKHSNWEYVQAGVPQGSILGPLLCIIFINDIVTDIHSSVRLFADDTSQYIIVENPTNAALNVDLLKISRKENKQAHPPLIMDNTQLDEVTSHKHIGIHLNKTLTWHEQILYVSSKAYKSLNI
jgi:hypothetical protein